MDSLHQTLLESLNKIIEENPEKSEEIDIEQLIADITPEAVRLSKGSLMKSAGKMLKEHRRLSRGFEKRNVKRWSKAFDLLEAHIVICTDAGEDFNLSYRQSAVKNNDLVFDIIVRHHARACHIAQEILCLLKSGYADAAHARWRALHEVNVTAMFIAKHGQECAERFYFHSVVDSYDGMIQLKKYEGRLQEETVNQIDIDSCKIEYDALIEKYGKKYGDHYGWASYIFPKHGCASFTSIEKDVGLDHMRPYYKMASQNIHSGSNGMTNRLGLNEANSDILLVGQSNSGMTAPAHSAAISLSQITIALLVLEPTLDHIVLMKIIEEFQVDIGAEFLEVERSGS